MSKMIAIVLFSLMTLKGFALEYGIDAKCEGEEGPVTKFKVYGERCSGTSFFTGLLWKNFPCEEHQDFAWKHFPPWFAYPRETELNYPEKNYTFSGGGKTLFVVIFRDPYDWVRSICNDPHHAWPMYGLGLNHFVRKEWEVGEGEDHFIHIIDRNPVDHKPFANVLKLRTAKIENMLLIKDLVDHIYFVNYEVVRDHPEEVINEIAQLFNLTPNQPFEGMKLYKGFKDQKYRKKRYAMIHHRTLEFINSQLDWELEESIGYGRIDDPKQIR